MRPSIRTFVVGLLFAGFAAGVVNAQNPPQSNPPAKPETPKSEPQPPVKAPPQQEPPKQSPEETAKPADSQGKDEAPGKAPRLKLSLETWDFGTVAYGDKVEYNLVLTNEGEGDLQIKNMKGSCSCTVPQKNVKKLLAPGETTDVKVSFNSKKKQGNIATVVWIDTNDPVRPRAEFHLRGIVKTMVDMEPPTGISIRALTREQAHSGSVKLFNRTDEAFKPVIKTVGLATIDVEIKEIEANKVYEVVARTKAPLPFGRQSGVIQLDTGLSRMPTMSIQAVSDMQELVEIRQPAVLVKKDTENYLVTVRYFGTGTDFKVTEVTSSLPGITVEQKAAIYKERPKPEEGKEAIVRVTAEIPLSIHVANPGEFPAGGGKLVVKTTDAQYPQLEVVVTSDRPTYSQVITAKSGTPDLSALISQKAGTPDAAALEQLKKLIGDPKDKKGAKKGAANEDEGKEEGDGEHDDSDQGTPPPKP